MNMIEGRVVLQEKGAYRIMTEKGEVQAVVSGKLKYEAKSNLDFPAVGDFVKFDLIEQGDVSIIHEVLDRKSVFIRKSAGTDKSAQIIASNIDTVFICMSLNNDFNVRRLERYLAAVYDSGATPIIVFTKSDLCDDIDELINSLPIEISLGATILTTSSLDENGINVILPYLKRGKTVAFVGSSGVGKSTLINRLIGSEVLATNGLRNDDKGRHTTTHRQLIALPNGAMVIDTPGMRELGMWGVESGIEMAFSEIEALAEECKYKNCTHTSEPGCAVRAAIASGELSAERFASYQKLVAENAYAEDAETYLAAKEKKFKEIAKYNKRNQKR